MVAIGALCVLPVALRKESVDRNYGTAVYQQRYTTVALRKESVDRNVYNSGLSAGGNRRSPQGERG